MCYRARVTLAEDIVVHTRPAAWIAHPLQRLEATVQFHRDDVTADIRTDLALFDVMQAAVDLGLQAGATFEVTCRGRDRHAAFQSLRKSFTTNYFEGSEFIPLESPEEAEDV